MMILDDYLERFENDVISDNGRENKHSYEIKQILTTQLFDIRLRFEWGKCCKLLVLSFGV